MSDPFFRPVSGFELPRFAGIPTFMRLPHVPLDHPRIGEVEAYIEAALGGGDQPRADQQPQLDTSFSATDAGTPEVVSGAAVMTASLMTPGRPRPCGDARDTPCC